MDGDEDDVVILECDFDDFLHASISSADAHETGKPANTVVNVNNEVARFELHDFF